MSIKADLSKFLNLLDAEEEIVKVGIYTKQLYEYDDSLKFDVGENYVLVLRSGKNHDSHWIFKYETDYLLGTLTFRFYCQRINNKSNLLAKHNSTRIRRSV